MSRPPNAIPRTQHQDAGNADEPTACSVFTDALDRLAPRPGKPRKKGLTSLLDYGPGLHGWTMADGTADFLALCGDFVDMTKIGGLNAIMLPGGEVRRTASIYRDHGIATYSGGLLFEFARKSDNVDSLPRLLSELGIGAVEISENYLPLTDTALADSIRRMRRHDLDVIYEYGRKTPDAPLALEDLRRKRDVAFNAGAGHVVIEFAEVATFLQQDELAWRSLCEELLTEDVFIELDPTDFPASQIAAVHHAGPSANLANVAPQHLLAVERLRRGLGYGAECPLMERSRSS
ncbi:MAG: phosphosulfolactate synthase [Roseitalea sp.]|jgi:phosphosulfolactate synthase|nr:phosphosulfolactate synthase [Roseitalea sp.]MBO6721220.1 phosphosulfolactate synthase [Roseitalea sp.]MBO6744278.1 phosphosulfolactate synthase [Roseitalea sp.]